ncbi:MAG TPA: hypothetical protein VK821_03590 [Dehalococcoidia bacterium]|nr:hypothetical protein [Dehalococcoidia bacterium]
MEEIPAFASEEEEVVWWESHEFTDRFLDDAAAMERDRRARGQRGDRPADRLTAARLNNAPGREP